MCIENLHNTNRVKQTKRITYNYITILWHVSINNITDVYRIIFVRVIDCSLIYMLFVNRTN